jgi:hypothetical protein
MSILILSIVWQKKSSRFGQIYVVGLVDRCNILCFYILSYTWPL